MGNKRRTRRKLCLAVESMDERVVPTSLVFGPVPLSSLPVASVQSGTDFFHLHNFGSFTPVGGSPILARGGLLNFRLPTQAHPMTPPASLIGPMPTTTFAATLASVEGNLGTGFFQGGHNYGVFHSPNGTFVARGFRRFF